uniref:Toll like receptor 8 n=1 Tax=Astatotilapia calliptera TaxID=8154 RepID=A0AAX7TCB4_ASTCA
MCCSSILPAACKPTWMTRQFPCDVISTNTSEVKFDCKGRHLEKVPEGITSNATDLDLSENFIKSIKADSLSNLLKLTQLNLNFANKPKNGYGCRKLNISANAFKNLTKIKQLELSGNCLTEIPRNLPHSVEKLDLNINKISLDKLNNSFIGLKNITNLLLSKNCYFWNPCGKSVAIMEKPFQILDKLQVLDLSYNNLTHIPKGLPQSITILGLDSNKIENISKDDFQGLLILKVLDIQGNCPRCHNAPYPCVPCPNGSIDIHPDAFQRLTQLETLNLGGNSLNYLDPSWFQSLKNLKELFVAFNFLQKAVTGKDTPVKAFSYLHRLEKLDMSFNYALGLYPEKLTLSKDFSQLRSLKTLHLEALVFQRIGPDTLTPLRNLKNLSALNLGTNFIIYKDVYEYLPRNLTTLWDKLPFHQLQSLDLSYNHLSTLTTINSNITQTLTFLDLSHNHISQVHNGFLQSLKSLRTLSLRNNKLTIVNRTTFKSGPEFQTLFLQGNPFECTCDSIDFILWIEQSDVKIPRLTTQVTCNTPVNQRNKILIRFNISQCVNAEQAKQIYALTTSIIILFMIVSTVAHLFYWDASYVLHYMKAKLKGYRSLNSPDTIYDVFVTYDTKDPHVSEWVMSNLRVQLEEEGDKIHPLCLEERDWPPGVPLVDNLTQSIQYSRKTLFVLTKGYVKTGAFKLAMYLAHQRLLDENVDVIVLLMLEPVLQHSHFLRLRKRLCESSVVEWPRTAAAEPWFWQNLRTVIRVDNQVMYNKTYSKYFTTK